MILDAKYSGSKLHGEGCCGKSGQCIAQSLVHNILQDLFSKYSGSKLQGERCCGKSGQERAVSA